VSADSDAAGVALFAKAPLAGRVKTRLSPTLSPEEAAEVAGACLADTLERLTRRRDLTLTLFLDGEADEALLGLATRLGVPIRPQAEGSLGARLRVALGGLLEAGHVGVIAVGSDSPTLPPTRVAAAAAALRAHDAVLGPTEDGGYYLIGVSRPAWALFGARAAWRARRVTARRRPGFRSRNWSRGTTWTTRTRSGAPSPIRIYKARSAGGAPGGDRGWYGGGPPTLPILPVLKGRT